MESAGHICKAWPEHHLGQGEKLNFISIHMNPKQFFTRYGDEKTLSQEVRERVTGARL